MNPCRFFVALSLVFLLNNVLLAFSGGPLPGLTGGFQEATCHACHSSFVVNEGRTKGGVFQIAGVPKIYNPGQTFSCSRKIERRIPIGRRYGKVGKVHSYKAFPYRKFDVLNV